MHAEWSKKPFVCIQLLNLKVRNKNSLCYFLLVDKTVRPMSHLQFYRAILSRNFIARQNRKCDMACRATSQQSRNSFFEYISALFCATLSRKCGERWLVNCCLCDKVAVCDTPCHTCNFVAIKLQVWHRYKGFDARLANWPFLVFDFRALWRSSPAAPELNVLKDQSNGLSLPIPNSPWNSYVHPRVEFLVVINGIKRQ